MSIEGIEIVFARMREVAGMTNHHATTVTVAEIIAEMREMLQTARRRAALRGRVRLHELPWNSLAELEAAVARLDEELDFGQQEGK